MPSQTEHTTSPILTVEQWLDMTPAHRERAFAEGFRPAMAGGDDGDQGAEGADAGDGADGDDGNDGDQAAGSGDGDGGDDEHEDASAAAIAALEKRLAAAERAAADANKAKRRAERAAEQRKSARAEEEGEFKTLYEQERAAREQLETRLRNDARDRAIISAASKLRFKDPEDAVILAVRNLPEDVVDEDGDVDEDAIDRVLKRIAKDKPYLTNEPEKPQGPSAGRGDRTQAKRRDSGGEYKFGPGDKLASGYATTTVKVGR